MTKDKWIWMPHAGHLIVGNYCRFHLSTYVGKYIVSTVGEYLPDSQVREIMAETEGIVLEGEGDAREYDFLKKKGYVEIGSGRLYETMVFKAKKSDHKCCPWEMESGSHVDMVGYNDPGLAMIGHLMACEKWSKGGEK